MAVMSKQVVLYEINDWFLIDGVTVCLVVYGLCMSLCVSCWCTSAKCLNAWSWVFASGLPIAVMDSYLVLNEVWI